jgi:hypothetical protein
MAGGKSRKNGGVSKKLIAHIKSGAYSNKGKKATDEKVKPIRKSLFGQSTSTEDQT